MRNTFEYLSALKAAATEAKRAGDAHREYSPGYLVEWVTKATSREEALRRIYSLASGSLFNYDDGELAYTLEDDWAAEGISDDEARERFYDRDLRREGERLIFG